MTVIALVMVGVFVLVTAIVDVFVTVIALVIVDVFVVVFVAFPPELLQNLPTPLQ